MALFSRWARARYGQQYEPQLMRAPKNKTVKTVIAIFRWVIPIGELCLFSDNE